MSISNPEVLINGVPWAIVPNSFEFDEGEPEGVVRAAVIGDTVEQDYSEDMTEAFSEFKFSVYSSVKNVNGLRQLKALRNTNTVSTTAGEVVLGVEQTLRRTFKHASITSKVKKPLGADVQMEVTWKSDAAV